MVRKLWGQGKLTNEASPRFNASPDETFPSSRHLKWSLIFLLVYFGLRLLFFALTISTNMPPDENTHLELSRIFSKVFFLPQNSPETYEYGLVTNIPWLYYWIMGKLLALNVLGISDLLFLRLLNIPFAFATIYFVRRMFRLMTDDRLSQVLLIVAMTNTIMFSFLSAFVTYDNLTNLLAAMAVYYLLAFFKTRSGNLLVLFFLCQMAGSLTKVTFLPLILVLNILLVLYEFKNIRLLPGALSGYFKSAGWRQWGLVLGFFFGLAMNVQLYGGNYYYYRDPSPGMSKVLSPEIAMKNRIEARNMIFSQFKEGRVSRDEAFNMASQIKHPGDRADTMYLIDNDIARRYYNIELMGPLAYTALWVWQMSAGIFGIFGHGEMFNSGPAIWPFAALGVLIFLSILIRWRPSHADWLPTCLMAIVAFYGLFLLYYVNYPVYLDTGVFGLTAQGRYLFPVLGAFYAVSSYYLPRLFRSRHWQVGISGAACLIFIISDFPFFLYHVTSDWFAPLFG